MKQWKYFNVKNKYINRFKGTSFNIFRDDTHILITLKFLRYNKNNYALSDIITYFSQRIGNFFVSLSKKRPRFQHITHKHLQSSVAVESVSSKILFQRTEHVLSSSYEVWHCHAKEWLFVLENPFYFANTFYSKLAVVLELMVRRSCRKSICKVPLKYRKTVISTLPVENVVLALASAASSSF